MLVLSVYSRFSVDIPYAFLLTAFFIPTIVLANIATWVAIANEAMSEIMKLSYGTKIGGLDRPDFVIVAPCSVALWQLMGTLLTSKSFDLDCTV